MMEFYFIFQILQRIHFYKKNQIICFVNVKTDPRLWYTRKIGFCCKKNKIKATTSFTLNP
jgi:hypothetical protein